MNAININVPDSAYQIEINLWGIPNHMNGEITSNIKIQEEKDSDENILPLDESDQDFNTAIDAIESLVLAHAIEGVDVQSEAYRNGLSTSIDACAFNL